MKLSFVLIKVITFVSCAQLAQGRLKVYNPNEKSTGLIKRKRETTEMPKTSSKSTNVFGKIVEDVNKDVNWNRILSETSFPEPQCMFDLKLGCFLSHFNTVSFLNEDDF